MSNILSASSNTKYEVRLKFVLPASKKSKRRPGVAMQNSAPDGKVRVCYNICKGQQDIKTEYVLGKQKVESLRI